jgi:hypothetical protein
MMGACSERIATPSAGAALLRRRGDPEKGPAMTRHELGARLDHLDPGASLALDERQIAELFGATALTDETVKEAEAFAEQHRCTFSRHEHNRNCPEFIKDDVF